MLEHHDMLVPRAMDAEHRFELDVGGPARAGREGDRPRKAFSVPAEMLDREPPGAHDVRCREKRDVGLREQ